MATGTRLDLWEISLDIGRVLPNVKSCGIVLEAVVRRELSEREAPSGGGIREAGGSGEVAGAVLPYGDRCL